MAIRLESEGLGVGPDLVPPSLSLSGRKLRLLDLYCKAGGATKGYQLAGFEVTGIDIEPQPHYCGDAFIQADITKATVEIDRYGGRWLSVGGHHLNLSAFTAIHASPPCQAFSPLSRATGKAAEWPNLLPQTRALLEACGLPYVIENVPEAPLLNAFMLCGVEFGLDVVRHRRFETNFFVMNAPCHHKRGGTMDGTYIPFRRGRSPHTGKRPVREQTDRGFMLAMGIDWMAPREARQAIPPAYTEWIGRRIIEQL